MRNLTPEQRCWMYDHISVVVFKKTKTGLRVRLRNYDKARAVWQRQRESAGSTS